MFDPLHSILLIVHTAVVTQKHKSVTACRSALKLLFKVSEYERSCMLRYFHHGSNIVPFSPDNDRLSSERLWIHYRPKFIKTNF